MKKFKKVNLEKGFKKVTLKKVQKGHFEKRMKVIHMNFISIY